MKITGKVYDKTNNTGIPYASVSIVGEFGQDLNVGTSADSNGNFSLDSDLIGYPNAVVFSSQSFFPVTVDASFFDGTPASIGLNENGKMPAIVVTAAKKNALPLALGLLFLLTMKKKKNVGEVDTKFITWGIVAVLGIEVASKLLQKVGIFQSQADKDVQQISEDAGSFWSPNFYKTLQQDHEIHILTDAATNNSISQIRDSFGLFTSNSEQAIGVFKQLNYQTQVSYLADKFQQQTGSDLLEYLKGQDGISGWLWNHLSNDDIDQLTKYIQGLPQY